MICDITSTGFASGTVEEFRAARPDLAYKANFVWKRLRFVVWDELDEGPKAFVQFGYELDELVQDVLRRHYG